MPAANRERCGRECLFPLGKFFHIFHQLHVVLQVLALETGNGGAEIRFVKLRVLVETPGQHRLAQRTERHEADAQFFQRGQQFRFGLPVPQGVFALHGGQRTDGVGTAHGGGSGLRQSPMQHLAFLYQFIYGLGYRFNRYIRICTMLVIKVGMVGTQTAQRAFHSLTWWRSAMKHSASSAYNSSGNSVSVSLYYFI